MSEVVRVNFGRPMPLFPLPEAVLLPHAVQPLHVFELRYRQLVGEALDSAGQIALATIADEDHGGPRVGAADAPLRPAVCIGQIVQHELLDDGRHNILLHGVCRAQLREVLEPEDGRLYRLGMLEPLEPVQEDEPTMLRLRKRLASALNSQYLQRLRSAETVITWFRREDLSTDALIELTSFALVRDSELRYQLLSEVNSLLRGRLLFEELRRIALMIHQTDHQSQDCWPKGLSWN